MNSNCKYNVLQIAHYKDTNCWDIKDFVKTTFFSQYAIDRLGKHIHHETNKIKPYEYPKKQFNILGISNINGMFDAYSEFGENIKQPYTIVDDRFLAYNPYRINVGSIGFKTDKLKNNYISPAYVVFSCKASILPEYLFLLMKTEKFNKSIRENTTGSVRQTLSYDKLSKINIPIPDTNKQKQLVETYDATTSNATQLRLKATILEDKIENILYKELGIIYFKKDDSPKNKLLNATKLSQCKRWAVDYLMNQHSLDFIHTSKYKLVPAKNFIIDSQYGLSNKASSVSHGIPVLRMNNIQNNKLDVNDLKYLPENTKNIEKYILNKGDLLFNRTNSKELVGKTAIFDLNEQYVFASYLIRIVLNNYLADVNYINILFASNIIRSQINLVSRQILGQANINVEELKDLLFPLPSINTQQKIVEKIMKIKSEVNDLRQQADSLRQYAKIEFEHAVFGK